MLSQLYFMLQSLIASVFLFFYFLFSYFPLKTKTNHQTEKKTVIKKGLEA